MKKILKYILLPITWGVPAGVIIDISVILVLIALFKDSEQHSVAYYETLIAWGLLAFILMLFLIVSRKRSQRIISKVMDAPLTHSIPVTVYSTNPVTFMMQRQKITEGKIMINEQSYVIPQFIPAYLVRPGTRSSLPLMTNNPAEIYMPPEMTCFWSYYGEYKCTKEEFDNWALKNGPKK